MANESAGVPLPAGATVTAAGVNFSLFSRHASGVELLLFDDAAAPHPYDTIPVTSRTLDYWHAHVDGLTSGAMYAWRVRGPSRSPAPHRRGNRYDADKALIDPCALGNLDGLYVNEDAARPGDNVATAMRSIVIDPSPYDWQGDQPPRTSWSDTVLYELHPGGFTRSPSSACVHPGTFSALTEKLSYIAALGVTAIELMPTFQFDAQHVTRHSPVTGEPLRDYWGYNPLSFFSPHPGYCVSPATGMHLDEFRDFVKAAHRLGLEVILDVVFNHTGEGDQNGPNVCFRGIDNRAYYMLTGEDGSAYLDLTGCMNTFNSAHPATAGLIRDALAHWVHVMHVDGFRFDLASVLTLGEDGRPLAYPPTLWATRLDPRLAGVKLIAEPFGGNTDTSGIFPDDRFATWNYRFRDTVRRFVRGDRGLIGDVATKIAGSSDLYEREGKTPLNGVSYVTCHDGMTLNDIVTYAYAHNEANGEISGDAAEIRANYGVEGPSATLEGLRRRQIKNHLTILFLSQGVPMLLAGDECRRTQRGNNNPYLQNNDMSWFDWTLPIAEAGLLRFVKGLVDFRKRHVSLRRDAFFTGVRGPDGLPDISWHGCALDAPGFADVNSGVLAFTISGGTAADNIHAILNMEDQTLPFELPPLANGRWFKAVDTSLEAPHDFAEPNMEQPIADAVLQVDGRTAIILVSR